MILPLIDKKIREAFSDSAFQYEMLAGLQKEIGRELIKKLGEPKEAAVVLDVGMGTGRLGYRLNFLYPDTNIIGIDAAQGMVEVAKNKYETLKVLQADARWLPFRSESFDYIISNLAYQWVRDLPQAFVSAHNVLKQDGTYCFTMFGGETLKELISSLHESLEEKKKDSSIQRLPGKDDVARFLTEAGFKDVDVSTELIRTHFPDMLSLIQWLKETGANRIWRDFYVGKDLLAQADTFYNKHFQDRLGIQATFEVIWIKTKKSSIR